MVQEEGTQEATTSLVDLKIKHNIKEMIKLYMYEGMVMSQCLSIQLPLNRSMKRQLDYPNG